MNYLLHCLISEPDELNRIGNLIGDFVKGPLTDQYPPAIMDGLRQHRQLDSYAERNSCFQRSRQRLDPRFGRYRGIMVDLFYDHIVAVNWHLYHHQPLEKFAAELYASLQRHQKLLPQSFQVVLPRMIEKNWLVSYREVENIQRALRSVSQRIKRPNILAEGIDQLNAHYPQLKQDCFKFVKQAQSIHIKS